MSLAVKSHQAFFLAARTDPAAGLVPLFAASLLSSRAFFPRRRPPLTPSWGRAAAGKECSLAPPSGDALASVAVAAALPVGGVRLGPGARPERPSIRGGPAAAPGTLYRIRLGRPARQRSRAHPSNERCLSRCTRRQNGGSLRPRLLHYSGGARTSFPPRCCSVLGASLSPYTPTASAAACFA